MSTKKIAFTVERETKNTYRFQEKVTRMEAPSIGVLYVQKHALNAIGFNGEQDLVVTLEVTENEN